MKIVVDTNVAVSGLLWGGPPNRILKWARDGFLKIINCEGITSELKRVLHYGKFSQRLTILETSPGEVIAYFMNLTTYVPSPESIPKIINEDLFDNIFLVLTVENKAHLIVSGDKHLLSLKEYKNIQIVTPGEASSIINTLLKKSV